MAKKKKNIVLNNSDKIETWYYEAIISLIILLPLIYTPWTFEIFAIPKVTLLRILGTGLLMAFCLETAWKRRIIFEPIHLLAFSFLLVTILTTLTSIHTPTSLLGLRRRYFGLITQIAFFGCYLAVIRITWTKGRIRRLLMANSFTALIVSLLGIAQTLGSNYPVDLHKYFADHAYSTFGNPNFLGMYLVMAVPLAIGLLLISTKPLDIWLASASAIAAIITIILTRSLGATTALLITLLFISCLFFLPNKFKISLRRALLIFVAITLLIAVLGGNLIVQSDSGSWQSRIRGWKAVARISINNPLLGIGLDTVRFASPRYLRPLRGYNEEIFEDGHNLILTTAATLGLPGLAILLFLLFATFRRVFVFLESSTSNNSDSNRVILLTGLASLIGYLAAEMVNPDFIVSATYFWIIIGLIISISQTKQSWKAINTLIAYPLTILIVIACSGAIILSSGSYLAEYFLLKAEETSGVNASNAYYIAAQYYNPYYDMYSVRMAERMLGLVGNGAYFDNIALNAAQKAITQSPREADNYIVMANIYRRLAKQSDKIRNLETAAAYCRKAIEKNPKQRFALQHLTEIFAELGQKKEALKWANRYLDLFSDPQVQRLRDSLR